MDIHKKQNVNKCQTCVVSSKRYDSSGEENKLKVILRRAKKEIDTHTQKKRWERIFKIFSFLPKNASTVQAIIDDIGP